jgi:bacillithiol synthase
MQEIGTARGSLYPLGKPQERALNFVPLLARYGPGFRNEMLEEARGHARRLVGVNTPLEEAVPVRGRS